MSNNGKLATILASYKGQKGALIPVLQKTQAEFGYLPEDALTEIAHALGVSASSVFGVASFYAQFRFTPQGEHVIKVCQGTACHVRGSARILEDVEGVLKIQPGGTTEDMKFSLERVACVGCCALAPVVVVDGNVHATMTPSETKKIISQY